VPAWHPRRECLLVVELAQLAQLWVWLAELEEEAPLVVLVVVSVLVVASISP
jgi:hypothetical protein